MYSRMQKLQTPRPVSRASSMVSDGAAFLGDAGRVSAAGAGEDAGDPLFCLDLKTYQDSHNDLSEEYS